MLDKFGDLVVEKNETIPHLHEAALRIAVDHTQNRTGAMVMRIAFHRAAGRGFGVMFSQERVQ